MSTENTTRIAELLSQLFLNAAEQQPDVMTSERVDSVVNKALQDRLPHGDVVTAQDVHELVRREVSDSDALDEDEIRDIIQGEIEDAVDSNVESALEDRLPYGELICAEDFDDYLRDSDRMSDFVTEDTVTELCMELISDHTMFAETTMEVVDELRRDLKTDISDAIVDIHAYYDGRRLSSRVRAFVKRVFTLTKTGLFDITAYRISFNKNG